MAAIPSPGLAMGGCTAAFRLIDAMLLRPQSVSTPERLHVITFQQLAHDGKLRMASSLRDRQLRPVVSAGTHRVEVFAQSQIRISAPSSQETMLRWSGLQDAATTNS